MPRKRNPKLEIQRLSQARVRERHVNIGVPESCAVDAAISAALFIHLKECQRSQSADPTIVKLVSIAKEILASATTVAGTRKYDPDICDHQVRHRASTRRLGDEKKLMQVRSKMVSRKRQREVPDVPF